MKTEEKTAVGFGMLSSAAAGAAAVVEGLGISAVVHSSGAAILSGASTGYMASTIGLTAAAVGALPAIAIGAGVIGAGAYAVSKLKEDNDEGSN